MLWKLITIRKLQVIGGMFNRALIHSWQDDFLLVQVLGGFGGRNKIFNECKRRICVRKWGGMMSAR